MKVQVLIRTLPVSYSDNNTVTGTLISNIKIGNSVTSVILLECEVSIALISCCLPGIFSLLKHTAEKGFLRLSSKSGSPNKAGGLVNIYMSVFKKKPLERGNSSDEQLEGG